MQLQRGLGDLELALEPLVMLLDLEQFLLLLELLSFEDALLFEFCLLGQSFLLLFRQLPNFLGVNLLGLQVALGHALDAHMQIGLRQLFRFRDFFLFLLALLQNQVELLLLSKFDRFCLCVRLLRFH